MNVRKIALLVVIVAVVATIVYKATLPKDDGAFYGYVEGDYTRLAPREGGTLKELRVKRGDDIAAGTVVAVLDPEDEPARLAEAKARLAQTEATLANLRKGKRTPEIDALIAQRAQAQASYAFSRSQYHRQSQLPKGQVVTEEKLDQTKANMDRDKARTAELDAQIAFARMAARDDEVDAAEADVAAARAQVRQAEWRVAQRTLIAPVDARVVDTLFVTGEYVAAGTPVVSMLAPADKKIRFFVPETALSRIRIGQKLIVACDGCAKDIGAAVAFVAPEAEFTPPVIYSRESRSKLVFMIEARPGRPAGLHPGQPVEIRLEKAP